MAMLETPSRILRRIEELEAQDSDLPSLPSFPEFEDSGVQSFQASSTRSVSPKNLRIEDGDDAVPYQSTPAPISSQTTRSTMRPPSTSSSATRFANSMRTSLSTARRSQQDSFEVSVILPTQNGNDSSSSASIPDVYLQPEDEHQGTPNTKVYDYSVSLRSEPRPSPLPLSRNVSIRKPLLTRTRTPSLSRTTPSPTSISSNSTPRSTHSALPKGIPSHAPSRNGQLEIEVFDAHAPSEVNQTGHADSQDMQESQHILEHEEGDAIDQSQEGGLQPTFSSEEHIQSSSESDQARTPFPNAFSSPTQPRNITPVSSLQPRVNNAVVDATPASTSGPSGAADDLATPYSRRRSFLLSLVHSTTRPRMTFPTPHPHTRAPPTPRPRTHPLAQAWTPSPLHLDARSNPSSGSSHSPHDRLSFISTASSHDLTVHPRANASFDPTTGAKGVGRFNAVKLNTYLHGLNRRLQEENEMLVSRLRMHGEEVEMGKMAEELERDGFKGIEEAVLEEVAAMRDELEKYEHEKGVMETETNAMVGSLRRERDEAIRQLDAEREEREGDKERWKNRMAEVEHGVEGVIKELERRLEDAEHDANSKTAAEEKARELEARCLAMEDDLGVAKRRAEKAEGALASSSDLGAELRLAHQHAAAHKEEVRRVTEWASQLERRLRDAEQTEKLRASLDDQLVELDAELRQSLEAQQSAEAHALELQDELKATNEHLEDIEYELSTSRQQVSQLVTENEDIRIRFEKQAVDVARATEVNRQMEDALEESERKMIADEEELTSLRTKATHLERELETLRAQAKSIASLDKNDALTRELTIREVDTEQLEAELDEAHREIGRLNHLLSESPTRKAIDKAKDVRIEILEREKDQLTDRVRALTSMALTPASKDVSQSANSPLSHRQVLVWRTPKTPGPPLRNHSWLHDSSVLPKASPLVTQIEHLQQELHLANNSVDEKVNMLEEAGMGIVGLTEKLEDAQTRTVTLEVEVARLVRREERRMRRMGRAKCLKCGGRVDLSKLFGVNGEEQSSEISSGSVLSDAKTPPSKTTEALRSALQTVNSELSTLRSQWDIERKRLLGEKAVLQDAANRLNVELGAIRDEANRALGNAHEPSHEARACTNVEKELDKAKLVVNALEDSLKDERQRIRALLMEQNRLSREKEETLGKLQRAQSDMDDVRTQLERVKRDNRELEAELRVTAILDQRARLLEAKVSENQEVIENLRSERESLTADHDTLQRRYVEASAQVNRLRKELSASQSSHDERRHQLDLRVNEIEDLRREVSEQARELERTESEKNQARAGQSGIVRSVTSLESDLRRVISDAEILGRDLKDLKIERDRSETRHRDELGKADRAQKQLSAQLRLATEQLEAQREKTKRVTAEWETHVCQSGEQDVDELRTQHKNECKGLMVQIRYLKAKFTRESVFREDLSYQKHYLLGILSTLEKSEKQIQAVIAHIGFPLSTNQPRQKRRRLRTVAAVVLFLVRTRRASEVWREQSVSKTAVQAALQDVRRRRIGGSLGYT